MKKVFTIAKWQKDPGQKVVNSKGEEINVCEKSLGWIMAHTLYIVDEPELTEFEQAVADMCFDWQSIEPENRIMTDSVEHAIKEHAAELLSLAREQLIHEGYIIEKKAFHDAVEKVEPEVKKEASANLDLANFVYDLGERYPEVSFAKLTRIAKAAYDYGKAEALKDLPWWKKEDFAPQSANVHLPTNTFVYKGYAIPVDDVFDKLPKEK